MTIHKEGYQTIAICGFLFVVINLLSFSFLSYYVPWLNWIVFGATLFLFLFIISFFRVPRRKLNH